MYPTFVIAGRLRRDYLLPPVGHPLIDVPGGDLLYAAAGLAAWEGSIGLLARVGEDYPHEWLRSFEQRGLDTRGIRILPEHLDLRFFQAYLDPLTPQRNNPVAHFGRLGLTYPKALLGYQPPSEVQDNRKMAEPASPRPADIPEDYLNASAVHLCPLDYLTHNRLISAFRQGRTSMLTLDPSAAYMTPATWLDVCRLLHGLTAFLPSEEELRALFWGDSNDLWEMAEELAAQGCELIVIKRGGHGQMLYDAPSRKRWEIPAYPAHLADPSGAGDSFCGGFLAGYRQTYDPLRAVLYGNVSASLTIEGSGAFHALDALPGLAQARLDSLAEIVRQV
ncbi:MAG: carbohydrate kinase family protein [Chloroflexi bacterium]|nr:carbohydrate kinase family protein [Chloroflexota bacterium]